MYCFFRAQVLNIRLSEWDYSTWCTTRMLYK